jgi:hypothetical protein
VSPCSHFQQKRNQRYAFLREAINRFLFMGRVIGPGDDLLLDKPSQPVGQDIRCDAFHRLGQEFAEMPSINENDVADDEQSPLIAEHFDRLVDNAFRPVIRAHAAPNSNGHACTYSMTTYNQLQIAISCVIPLISNSGDLNMPQCSHSNHRDAVKASSTGSSQHAGVEDSLIQVHAINAFWNLLNRIR